MKTRFLLILLIIISAISTAAWSEPFNVTADLAKRQDGSLELSVNFKIEKDNFLYKDQINIKAEGVKLEAINLPEAEKKKDKFTGEETLVYKHDFTYKYKVQGNPPIPLKVTIDYQGCNLETCFLPQSVELSLKAGETPTNKPSGEVSPSAGSTTVQPSSGDWKELADKFNITATGSGYKGKQEFIEFLNSAEAGKGGEQNMFGNKSILLTILLILLGGLALNLTPCILPMIPINLMIIGAGATASSKGKGFSLGATYGAGIALSYGLLGLVVVLTGSRFGTLNSSPWFNLVIAIIFTVLALSMFGVFIIDFTRFSSKLSGGSDSSKGSYLTAFIMGGVSALLAGACVAPVVISVLVLAGTLYASGNAAGLLLPFLLGIGMALPWPFAGAGMSFLPKPGMWMEKVKYVFGIIIVLFAVYYGFTAYKLFQTKPEKAATISTEEGWETSLEEGLAKAEREGKPVFIDFWASWCKNCEAMEKTTFKDPDVRKRLDKYIKIKYQAEKPNESPTKDVMKYYNALGLPTYVIIEKKK